MSWIWTAMVALSILAALVTGRGSQLAAAIPQGAHSGVSLALSLAGSVCLWSGAGKVMEKAGLTGQLARWLSPLLGRLFPSFHTDRKFAEALSANVCANFLGLGNAATPMGIQAARRLAGRNGSGIACDQLCRLVVLNTASIQLLPTNVAAIRTALGCSTPFDILPAVWLTSICSAGLGLAAAWLLGRLWKHG